MLKFYWNVDEHEAQAIKGTPKEESIDHMKTYGLLNADSWPEF